MKSLNTVLSGAVRTLKEEVLSFIYPSHCIHCNERVESDQWICLFCKDLIEFAEPTNSHKSATLQSLGSAGSFLKAVQTPLADKVAKAIAAFMVMQLQRLNWPLPDRICPSPKDPFNLLIAKHLSFFLSIPATTVLKLPGFFSLPGYQWRRTPCLSDQRLLVVDMVLPDLEEFDILKEADPKEIFYLSFV